MKHLITPLVAAVLLAGCATTANETETATRAAQILRASFKENGQAKLDRLDQDAPQAQCSTGEGKPLSQDAQAKIETAQRALVKLPADGRLLGDWRAGERIAQSGVGKQFSDNPANPAGGNCYACHQLSPQEISYGTIGPSLLHFGKLRGNSRAIQEYTFSKIWNAQAFNACSNMPRFGHNGILTEQQVRDLTALLLDPESPVNK